MAPIRVAAVQAAPIAYDLPASLAKFKILLADAKKQGAQLVVFPEAFLSAYPRNLDFKIGARTQENRDWYARYLRSSVRVPDDIEGKDWAGDTGQAREEDPFWAFGRLSAAAKESQVYLSVGIVERSIVGATLWCTCLLFSPSGVLLSKHRKLQPTAAERVVWGQGEAMNGKEGDNMAVVQTELGRIGGLICWENFMPLARYVLYRKGVEIYTAPTADARPTWLPSMQHIAQEGRCFVISANQYHTPDDFPSDYPPKQPEKATQDTAWSRGGSCIIGPLGEVLAGPLWDKEGILTANIELSELEGARLDFDAGGHYGRHELLSGLVARS